MSDQYPATPAPDTFARAGQAPQDATPWSHFPPPDANARPYVASGYQAPPQQTVPWPLPVIGYPAPGTASSPYPQTAALPTQLGAALGGATAVGGPRRSKALGRLLAGAGSLAAVAMLVAASGLLSGRGAAVTWPQTGTQPAASAPAAPSGQSGTGTGGTGAGTGSGSPTGTGTSKSSTQTNVTAAQSKGVVLIDTTLPNGTAAGTGMVLDASGLVLTNYHVVQGSTAVKVTVASTGETYTASVVGHDATNDVALIKLDGASGLDTVTIDQDAVAQGQTVTAVGNANGQEFLSAASGQITDTSATVTVANDSASGTETLKDVYETNAQAQPGDSGGPLFDAQTEVTGMTTAGEQTYRGPRTGTATTVTSYAIPIARALSIVKQIETGTSSGTVQVGPNAYLGIMVSTRTSGAAVVSSVTSGTPAARAGITQGSTITKIAGSSVSTQAQIASALSGHRPGDTVSVAWTDASGTTHTAQMTLAASPVN